MDSDLVCEGFEREASMMFLAVDNRPEKADESRAEHLPIIGNKELIPRFLYSRPHCSVLRSGRPTGHLQYRAVCRRKAFASPKSLQRRLAHNRRQCRACL